jgi:hypothetical protein
MIKFLQTCFYMLYFELNIIYILHSKIISLRKSLAAFVRTTSWSRAQWMMMMTYACVLWHSVSRPFSSSWLCLPSFPRGTAGLPELSPGSGSCRGRIPSKKTQQHQHLGRVSMTLCYRSRHPCYRLLLHRIGMRAAVGVLNCIVVTLRWGFSMSV